jgi:GDSL-like lipase/acylhydrolase family protein
MSYKSIFQNIALFTVSLVLALVAAEIVLRSLGYYGEQIGSLGRIRIVDDEVLGIRGQPNAEYFDGTYQISRKHNSHGWRDYEYGYEKGDDVFRIVVLGDSVLNGHGVWLHEVFAKRLEEKLNNNSDVDFEVVMLSLAALNSIKEAHLLEVEGAKYDPDMVLVGYVLNDPAPQVALPGYGKEHSNSEKIKSLLKKSSLVLNSWRLIKQIAWDVGDWNLGHKGGAARISSDFFTQIHDNEENWNTVLQAFHKISVFCQERQIPGVVAIFPVLYEFDTYPWLDVHSKVADAAENEGLYVKDLLPSFQTTASRAMRLTGGDFVHPNAAGHELAGEAIYRFLLEQELLQGHKSNTD